MTKNNQKQKKELSLKKSSRLLKGKVISDKMDKTIVVLVDRYKMHPKYKKRYKISKKYKAHNPKNQCRLGEKVIIRQCRPVSREKRWIAEKENQQAEK